MKFNNRASSIPLSATLLHLYLAGLESAAKTLPGSDQRTGAVDALFELEHRITADERVSLQTTADRKAA